LVVKWPLLNEFLKNRIIMPPSGRRTVDLVFGKSVSAQHIDEVLSMISRSHLKPHRLFIKGNLGGSTQLMPMVKDLHDNGNLEKIRLYDVQLSASVIDDRVLLPKEISIYPIKPRSFYYSISSSAFNAMVNDNPGRFFGLGGCKGIDADFVESAIETWKTTVQPRVKQLRKDHRYLETVWSLPIASEHQWKMIAERLQPMLQNRKNLETLEPMRGGYIYVYEDYGDDFFGGCRLNVKLAFAFDDEQKTAGIWRSLFANEKIDSSSSESEREQEYHDEEEDEDEEE